MLIQRATPKDAEMISEMEIQIFGEDSLGPSSIRQELTIGWGALAQENGDTVGYALVRPGKLNDLLRLGVSEKSRRRGIARALIEEARRQNPGPMMLFVRKNNPSALSLYLKLGFQVEGQQQGSWLMVSP